MFEKTNELEQEKGIAARIPEAPEAEEMLSQLGQLGAEANRLRRQVANAVEDRYDDARRAIRRGRYAAGDAVDETAYRIKRDPFSAVAVTFGAGLVAGVLIGWLMRGDRR